ncbi:MAG: MMPL family transporter [Treponema sp.]|nr:MMPL family transporter [Treponema sp.]
MKELNSFHKSNNSRYVILWLAFHVLMLILFLCRLFVNQGQISLDADLFNITPRSIDSEPLKKADEKLTEATGNNAFIIVANPDFEKAKATAETVCEKLDGSDNFISISLHNDTGSYSEISDFLFKYRWNLLDDKSIDLINSENGPERFSDEALAKVFGVFTLTSLDNLPEDPFMLTESALENYLMALQNSGTAMNIKDGMLVSEQDGIWYVLIRCLLSKKGGAMASRNNGINEIYSVCSLLENDGTQFIFSGTPYHSNDSSTKASKEITLISIVSFLAVLLMLVFIFRTPVPILFSLSSIAVSVGTAFIFTLAVFDKLMILTLVFGTSLIGSGIDYSLHYFVHWAGNPDLSSGGKIRHHLFRGLTMAIVSSGLCYAILIFAPFELLKQISVFSLVGLTSSFLTTICIYPVIPLPKRERTLPIKSLYENPDKTHKRKFLPVCVIAGIAVFSVCAVLFNQKYVGVENDISKYYTMEGRLLQDEVKAAQILQYSPTGWFVISGDDENQVLRNEEEFRKILKTKDDIAGKYLSTTLFIPSVEHQKKSRAACEKLLQRAEFQYEFLGIEVEEAESLRKDFYSSGNDYISFENGTVPGMLSDSISSVYLGEINGRCYSVLVPSMTLDEKLLSSIADEDENVSFISKRSDISSSLDRLTKMVLYFFAGTYVLIFIILTIVYSWKRALKIISVPLLIILATSAVFALLKTKLEFFSVTGMILVFGLGLDYVIYIIENEKKQGSRTAKLEPFTIALSFATTLISFGALALSSFKPVHLIGLSISIGLATAFICSWCYGKSGK